ncbi:MAG: ABC transporter substrate-binding protein [Candidatus Rokubacteria bacterium]|nr:ABC transporter substrate-binding protein [Candidatus Rokubacteria bacterium]
MYGKASADFPQRIVCLTAEHAEICRALGAGDRVVGASGTARPPLGLETAPRLGGVTSLPVGEILALCPDLVLAFSDVQAEVVAELIRAGLAVLCTNQRSVEGILETVLLVGGALGLEAAARGLVLDMRDEIRQVREYSSVWPQRPRVYFEEWPDPMIAGIRWVSEIVEIAGGRDVFPELRACSAPNARVVDAADVLRRDPEIILASWGGAPVDIDAIAARPGWTGMSAVRAGRIHEVPGGDILSPGPSVLAGLRAIHEVVQTYMEERS